MNTFGNAQRTFSIIFDIFISIDYKKRSMDLPTVKIYIKKGTHVYINHYTST